MAKFTYGIYFTRNNSEFGEIFGPDFPTADKAKSFSNYHLTTINNMDSARVNIYQVLEFGRVFLDAFEITCFPECLKINPDFVPRLILKGEVAND